MSGGIQWVALLLRVAHLKQLHQVSNHSSVDDLHVVEQEESWNLASEEWWKSDCQNFDAKFRLKTEEFSTHLGSNPDVQIE